MIETNYYHLAAQFAFCAGRRWFSSEFLSCNEKWIYPPQFYSGHSLVYFAANGHKHKVQNKTKISATPGISGCGSKAVDEQHQGRSK